MKTKEKSYPAEGIDSYLYFCDERFANKITYVLEFGGRLDAAALREATRASMQTLPIMGCRFDASGWKPVWRELPNAADLVFRAVETDDRKAAIDRIVAEEIGGGTGVQLRVTLIQNADGDLICISASHIVCDGRAMFHYCRVLNALYDAYAAGETPEPPPFVSRGYDAVFESLTPAQAQAIRSFRFDEKALLEADDTSPFPHDPTGEVHRLVEHIPDCEVPRIKAALKQQGYTVNDLVVASVGRAWFALFGGTAFTIPNTMDLRRFFPAEKPFGIANYVGKTYVHLKKADCDTIENATACVHAQMEENKKGLLVLKQAAGWRLAERLFPCFILRRIVRRKLKNFNNIYFSNPGKQEEFKMGFGGVPVLYSRMFTPPMQPPCTTVGASGLLGRIGFGTAVFGGAAEKEKGLQLLREMAAQFVSFGARESDPDAGATGEAISAQTQALIDHMKGLVLFSDA